MPLTALALNCTLKTKAAEEASSTDCMLKLLAASMKPLGVETEFLQLADHDIKPGVTSERAMIKKVLAAINDAVSEVEDDVGKTRFVRLTLR